jgi:hypothetical protein
VGEGRGEGGGRGGCVRKNNSYFFDLKNMISTHTKEIFLGVRNGPNFARFCKKD